MARLLGGLDIKKPSGSETGFRLNLFMTDEEEEYDAAGCGLGGCDLMTCGQNLEAEADP